MESVPFMLPVEFPDQWFEDSSHRFTRWQNQSTHPAEWSKVEEISCDVLYRSIRHCYLNSKGRLDYRRRKKSIPRIRWPGYLHTICSNHHPKRRKDKSTMELYQWNVKTGSIFYKHKSLHRANFFDFIFMFVILPSSINFFASHLRVCVCSLYKWWIIFVCNWSMYRCI